MHTLAQLKSGELTGATRLDLSEQLEIFPREIFDLADSLEVLNLSGNRLSSLPPDLWRLRKLRILFCSDNAFTEVPAALGKCPNLEMIGFKANRIRRLPAEALPPKLRWLILTDNQLESLPDEIGRCARLQKLMLAGNRLQALPEGLSRCLNLELLRIAANQLPALPDWLLTMPRLAWLAFAGNPFSDTIEAETLAQHPLPPIGRDEITLGDMLGQGASGVIHQANWQYDDQVPRAMAVKLFKGTVTSDGLPHSEMAACIAAGEHPSLIGIAGPLAEGLDTLPGLLMELIASSYRPLAGPPSLASCTRDCYEAERRFSVGQVLRIATSVTSVVSHLHQRGILHGDLYGHNLLVDPNGDTLLSDFGAASFYSPQSVQGQSLERLEVRAFGCLLEELLERCDVSDGHLQVQRLHTLQRRCLLDNPAHRPRFSELQRELKKFDQVSLIPAS
ncbi:leucine-rich repeat-containing serine/threonine-protein kinase [Pseudomonas stutzeri]|uniref:leucine-rich repeat-containing protein kinase family protein n=1 Tax=Stutzerimonas stutzeri TaxID=316 RepID=UPI00210EFA0A|nr:leucine-rich repeat-containing protein kinase family protein [Stutzerimonas stutzeri]MCQ4288417.1 leucine-rich repeat-containing serine/threonine-protein kinase [Stutzerimonas stutzeri]